MRHHQRMSSVTAVCVGVFGLALTFPVPASAVIDDDAAVVLLRSDCSPVSGLLDNCFETTAALFDLTTGWVWDIRIPTASTPLLVDIGPGTFGPLNCKDAGFVTLRGSGRTATKLLSTADNVPGANIENCVDIDFMDLTVAAENSNGVNPIGVNWVGTGSSNWTNVDILGHSVGTSSGVVWGWRENNLPCAAPVSEHFFYSSTIFGIHDAPNISTTYGFEAACSINWIFGGEIVASTGGIIAYGAVIHDRGDFRVFGSPIRAESTSTIGRSFGAYVTIDGVFHMHGGNIVASGDTIATALFVANNAFVHTVGTAMRPTSSSTGTAKRIDVGSGSPRIESPLIWYAGTDAPTADLSDPSSAFTTSITGADMFVETDCDNTGCSGSPNTPQPHLMIYSESCTDPTGGPWFDTARGKCRE